MISKRLARFAAVAVLAFSTAAMTLVSFEAEARRSLGGGKSFGRQSSNVMQQRQAVQPPAATTNRNAATPANANAARSGAAAQPRSGFSRFLGPIAGIAAGLGIAALLSSLGLGGALLEALSSAILIALVVFAVIFVVRRLRGGSRTATQAAGPGQGSPMYRESTPQMPVGGQTSQPQAAPMPFQADQTTQASTSEPVQPIDPSWFIPADFDITSFLNSAKQQFRHIQELWDQGNPAALREYLTDDLLKELTPEIQAREGAQHTQIVLLNAELLGIEKVADGHLASVRYSGMLREDPNAEAFSFEEVWNLYKADGAGWLLAGIQQINSND